MGNLDGLGYDGATVVVTGCASGMGAATAKILGDLGAKVHAVDIQEPTIPNAGFYRTDLADPKQIDATAARLADVGSIDYLFNCAGVPHTFGPLQCVVINYIGLRYLADQLLPHLADGAGMATIASDAGIGWQANLATISELLAIDDPHAARRWCEEHPEALRADGYSFSKEMLIAWIAKTAMPLAEERKIRTNCIAPCPTSTAFMTPTVEDIGQEFFDKWPYPLTGRMATAEEQAWPLVLLNSKLNAVVTGTVLYTDQGFAGGVITGAIDPAMLAGT
jgi:NAD(P)-dependent dehydrogenase (short-subunit alcohol dehydrogenase family)